MADVPADGGPLAPAAFLTLPTGLRVRYRLEGSGPTVLMLHGIGCSLEDFDEQHRLLRGRYRCLSVDLAGFGESDPLPVPNTLDRLADTVVAFLDALAATGLAVEEPLHVVGNSLGGAVAQAVAVRIPSRVRSLLLADPAGFGRTVTWALRIVAVRPLAKRLLTPSLQAARRNQRGIFHDRAMVTPERVERAFRLASRPHGPQVMAETAHDLGTVLGVRPGWRRRLVPAVAALHLPTLVVWGAEDLVLPADHLDAVRRLLPHAETHVFPGTGHMPQIERAAEFAALAEEFWSRLPAPDPHPQRTHPGGRA
ncbi:alpha/beta fold hydrolase [Kineococcus rubinsiae]|uniref:alpha/beta fold hydrolase n=1 Tax=Kineococcus rubinsiae TaxID=2609562 RepID=UPI001AD8D34A|nr:alpha/beta fold hydrolase [Kineococcus rubinsiae]